MSTSNDVKIGNMILSEDDLEFTVAYKGEIFTLQYPTPYGVAQIESEIVRKLGGFPRTSYPPEHLANIEATAYANELVIRDKSPSWFKSAWLCYDTDCITAIYRGYLAFRGEFQDRFRNSEAEGLSKRPRA